MAPFKLFFKNGLISCQGEFKNGKKSGKWKYFLNNGQMQSSGSYKDGKIAGRWKWFLQEWRIRGGRVASTMKSRSTVHGSDTTPMVSSGTKGALNMARRESTWKVYDETGELLKTQSFK